MKRTKRFRRKGIVMFSVLLGVFLVFAIQSKFIKVTVQSDSSTITTTSENFIDTRKTSEPISLETIENSSNKSVVLFTSNWCGSCLRIVSNLETYAQEYPLTKFYIIDFETNRDFALSLNIGLIPTLVLIEKDSSKEVSETQLIAEVRVDQLENALSTFNKIGIR